MTASLVRLFSLSFFVVAQSSPPCPSLLASLSSSSCELSNVSICRGLLWYFVAVYFISVINDSLFILFDLITSSTVDFLQCVADEACESESDDRSTRQTDSRTFSFCSSTTTIFNFIPPSEPSFKLPNNNLINLDWLGSPIWSGDDYY